MLLDLTCSTSFDTTNILEFITEWDKQPAETLLFTIGPRLNCRCQYGYNWLVPDRIICVIYRIVCVLLYFGWVTSTGIISYYLIGLIKYCCVFRLSNFNFICSRERRFKLECCRCFREEVITDAIYPDTEWDVEPQEEQLSVRSRLCDWLKR